MKLAIYIEDGSPQLVLTAESDFERVALKAFYSVTPDGMVFKEGSFYTCAGGWSRHSGKRDDSLILVAIKP